MTVQESSIEVNPGDPSSRSGGTRDDMLLVIVEGGKKRRSGTNFFV